MDLNGFYQKSEAELLRALNQFREVNGESFKREIDKFINEKLREYKSILDFYYDVGYGQGQNEDYMYFKNQLENVLPDLLKLINVASKVGVFVGDIFEELVDNELSFEETLNIDFKKKSVLSKDLYNQFKEVAQQVKDPNALYSLYFMTGDIDYFNKCVDVCTFEQLIKLFSLFKEGECESEVVINDKPNKASNRLTISDYPLYILDGKNFDDMYELLIKRMVQDASQEELKRYYKYDPNIDFSIFDCLVKAWRIGIFNNADEFARYALDREYYPILFAEKMQEEELFLDFTSDEVLLEIIELINNDKEKCLAENDKQGLSCLIDQEIQAFLALNNPNIKGVDKVLSRFNTQKHLNSWVSIAKRLLDCENVNAELFKFWVQKFFKNDEFFKKYSFVGNEDFSDFIAEIPETLQEEKQALQMWRYCRDNLPTQIQHYKNTLHRETAFYKKTGYLKTRIIVSQIGTEYLSQGNDGIRRRYRDICGVRFPVENSSELPWSENDFHEMKDLYHWQCEVDGNTRHMEDFTIYVWCVENKDGTMGAVHKVGLNNSQGEAHSIDQLYRKFNDEYVIYLNKFIERANDLTNVVNQIVSSYSLNTRYDRQLLQRFEELRRRLFTCAIRLEGQKVENVVQESGEN